MRHSETIEVEAVLSLNGSGVEDLHINWYVTATARVRHYGGSHDEPPETLVEDITVEDVRSMETHIGDARFDAAESVCRTNRELNNAALIDWLNAQMADQDDWRETITALALAEFSSLQPVAA